MYTPRRIAAFTLIEMIVVITVIMLMFGTLMSGLTTMQKSTDTLSTPAVIQAVHESCFRNARQFGSAALVYGFTLDFGDGVASPGDSKTSATAVTGETASAIAIIPWVIVNTTTNYNANVDLFTDIGRQPLWDTATAHDRIYFDDRLRPSRQFFTVDTTGASTAHTTSVAGNRYLHVGYEPKTGFCHAIADSTDDPATSGAGLKAATISDPTSLPSQVILELRDTKNNTLKNRILITYTGVIDAHAKL
jgi:type II secretory pathway pseudopilin PulG